MATFFGETIINEFTTLANLTGAFPSTQYVYTCPANTYAKVVINGIDQSAAGKQLSISMSGSISYNVDIDTYDNNTNIEKDISAGNSITFLNVSGGSVFVNVKIYEYRSP